MGRICRAGGGDDSSRYGEYEDGYSLYRATRVAGYTLWGLGGAGLIGAFLIPGDREPLAPTLRDKLLLAAGMVLLTAGNIFHSCSLNALAEAEERWDEYLNAGAAQESLLPPYEKTYDRFTLNRFLAYGFWIGGGVLVLTSLFMPSKGPAAHGPAVQPVSMDLVPLDQGIRFAIRIGL